jgi:hypothetical protein
MLVTVKLGLFTMPFHHPDRDYGQILAEDQEAIVLADRLGFTDAFVGEHFSSWSERITSPLIFFATLIPRTTRITFGTGVINLPQMHDHRGHARTRARPARGAARGDGPLRHAADGRPRLGPARTVAPLDGAARHGGDAEVQPARVVHAGVTRALGILTRKGEIVEFDPEKIFEMKRPVDNYRG